MKEQVRLTLSGSPEAVKVIKNLLHTQLNILPQNISAEHQEAITTYYITVDVSLADTMGGPLDNTPWVEQVGLLEDLGRRLEDAKHLHRRLADIIASVDSITLSEDFPPTISPSPDDEAEVTLSTK
jgi:hypothetical protein